MTSRNMGGLLEKRRTALVEYCIGQVKKERYPFVKTPADLFELLRLDPLDSYPVQNSWLSAAVSSAQQYINAAYSKLEPGYTDTLFEKEDLDTWALYNNYPDWAALQFIACYPENFITPFVRQRKTSLFKNLENSLNQSSLSVDTVQAALQEYLQTFEKTCNLEVISCYMDGASPTRAVYYFIGRTLEFQYFWRKAEVELNATDKAINPAAWSEWRSTDIAIGSNVLDVRPVFWNGRLCLIWAEWREASAGQSASEFLPAQLTINLSYKKQNDQWSPPLNLLTQAYNDRVLPQNTQLVATLMTDDQNPKGKLGVMLKGILANPFEVFVVRDVLLRPIPPDDGSWVKHAADSRFKTRDTVQHPLINQPPIVPIVETPGNMTDFLTMQAVVFRVGEQDWLFVRGICRSTTLTGANVSFTLKLVNRNVDDPEDIVISKPVGGNWGTDWQVFKRTKGAWGTAANFSFGATAGAPQGRVKVAITAVNVTDFIPPALLRNRQNAAQFLSLNQLQLTLKYCRLNSLFGPDLVLLSNISVDAVLDWSTQFLKEPCPDPEEFDEPNGAFDGANGLFFWELFFHLPHLVATRLSTEDRFAEAQNWLKYIFDPQGPADKAPLPPNPKKAYWRCRPLANEAGNPGYEAQNPTDPDAIGYAKPMHFQILMFTEYVQNLIAWGDWYYRQLTRDSLAAAKLCYVQAEFLMGKAPTVRSANTWDPATVGSLLDKSRSRTALEAFELKLDFSLGDIPAPSDTPPRMGLLANDPFKIPINQKLLDLFALPGQRLHNLRNNLTLDGKPMEIALFSPPTDAKRLLHDLASGGVVAPRPMGGRLVVGAFRWRVMYETALRAVQTLQDYGNQVLNLLDRRDRAQQEEMHQDFLRELGTYAETVQQQTIDQMSANVTALEASRAVAQQRTQAYAQLYDRNVSDVEYQVMESLQASKILSLTSSSIKPIGALLASLPNIFGLANGGHRLEKIGDAVCFGLDIAASVLQIDADKQAITEAYRRRREEWELQRNQASAEVLAIDAQIAAQRHAVTAAQTSLEQTLRANSQALTIYNFLKTRATNAELYGWMLGQLKALHYQAYDAVISLCISARASLNAETGNFDSLDPLLPAWVDARHGLTAGEHLRAHLLRMEREYLQRHERRQELVKTVSLRQLFDDTTDPQAGFANWNAALTQLKGRGTLEFKLSQLLFDRAHPGHYCRQISMLEVDLPMLKGPYEDVRATLLQISSKIATKPTVQSVKYLHDETQGVATDDVLVNLRSGQQITLSAGIADNGMAAMKPDEGMLNVFENTGVVSRMALSFPRHKSPPQEAMLNALTDVIIRIRYTAKTGEPTFVRQVEDLVTKAETTLSDERINGADSHA